MIKCMNGMGILHNKVSMEGDSLLQTVGVFHFVPVLRHKLGIPS